MRLQILEPKFNHKVYPYSQSRPLRCNSNVSISNLPPWSIELSMAGHLGQQPSWTGRVSTGTVCSMGMGAVPGNRILHLTHHTGVSGGVRRSRARTGTYTGSGTGGMGSTGAVPGKYILYLLHKTWLGTRLGTRLGTSVGSTVAVPGNCILYLLHKTWLGTSLGSSLGTGVGAVPGNCILYLLHKTWMSTSLGTSVDSIGALPGNCIICLLHNTSGLSTSGGTCHCRNVTCIRVMPNKTIPDPSPKNMDSVL
jgi:hypothetical protein